MRASTVSKLAQRARELEEENWELDQQILNTITTAVSKGYEFAHFCGLDDRTREQLKKMGYWLVATDDYYTTGYNVYWDKPSFFARHTLLVIITGIAAASFILSSVI